MINDEKKPEEFGRISKLSYEKPFVFVGFFNLFFRNEGLSASFSPRSQVRREWGGIPGSKTTKQTN